MWGLFCAANSASAPAPAPAPAPAAGGGGSEGRMDYAQQVRDAKKAKDDQEAEIHQSALNLARYQEKAQAAAASGDKEGSFSD